MTIEQESNTNRLLDYIHIKCENVSAKIYPKLGGSLQELTINGIKIIDGISHDASGLEDYRSTYKSSILFPFPNRIEDGIYKYKNKHNQFPINEKPLNNAIHGLVYNKSFELINKEANKENASVTLTYKSNGESPGFPYSFELLLTYKISNTGNVKLLFEVENIGKQSFPMGMGWHPYFAVEDLQNCDLSFPSKEFYKCNERNLPIQSVDSELASSFKMKNKTFDDAYSLENSCCEFSAVKYQLRLDFDYAQDTFLQVYTPPHRNSIAIEPMTSIANSFNNKIGLKELQPGEKDHWTIKLNTSLS